MNREVIKNNAIKKMEAIEDQFQGHVPPEVQQYYLLQTLIVNGLQIFIDNHGFYPLDKNDCAEGKALCGFGKLSFFENDCILFLTEILDEKERHVNKSAQNHQLTLYRS